ncbi:MAG: DUF447 domain-containing protein [Pirellulales bacterium]
MIIEGIVTTTNPDGGMHVAAMGPAVDNGERLAGRITRLVLRPFATSHTAANLARVPAGVFHLTDDVLLLARIVAGRLDDGTASRPADRVPGWVLVDACQAWEFSIDAADVSGPRSELSARVEAVHAGRPFIGFNRAAHAVVEAAILVTRLHILERDEIRRQFADLRVLVEKTGGPREHEAFSILAERVAAA